MAVPAKCCAALLQLGLLLWLAFRRGWLAFRRGDPPPGSPCGPVPTLGCRRWDEPDPNDPVLSGGPPTRPLLLRLPFIVWSVELSAPAAGARPLLHHLVRRRHARGVVSISAHRLVLGRGGRLRQTGTLHLRVQHDAYSASVFGGNVSRDPFLREAVPLSRALQRFAAFASRDLPVSPSPRGGRLATGLARISTRHSILLSRPGLGVRLGAQRGAQSDTARSERALGGYVALLSWGNQWPSVLAAAKVRPEVLQRGLGPVLHRLSACSRDLRPVLVAAPLNLSGWTEATILAHPGMALLRNSRAGGGARAAPCESSLLALQAVALRSEAARRALRRAARGAPAAEPPAPSTDGDADTAMTGDAMDDDVAMHDGGEWQLPSSLARQIDRMHDTAVGGTTPAVQASWPKPF